MRPTPCPPGLARTVACTAYDGLAKAMVIGLKERRQLALADPLGDLLARSVRVLADPGPPVLLVPVPSRPTSVRARGLDSTRTITARAARRLRAEGYDVAVAPLLRTRPGLRDQAGLSAAARAANLAGSLTCPSPRLRRVARRRTGAVVVVCDDVLTTGATARWASRWPGSRPSRRRCAALCRREAVLPFLPITLRTNVTAWSPSGSVVASFRRPGSGCASG
jgi:predicted amidophosphoribosyltransferase